MKNDFNIFELDDDVEWSHIQIRDHLWEQGVECIFVDMWVDDMAFILGCNSKEYEIAKALNLHEESIYFDYEHSLVILNLYQEKHLRGLL